jgi:hypothetical protein
MTSTPFQRSELTAALVRYLASHDKGTHLGYEELSLAAEAQITSRSTNLISARHILERDHSQVWIAVPPRLGVYRLTDPEIAERQRTWFLAGARNKLTNGAKQADVVEIERLDMTQQARFATSSIVREIARNALDRATQRKVDRIARGSSNDLPSFNAVEWMISLSPKRAAAG